MIPDLSGEPEVEEMFRYYLLLRDTGRMPWEFGFHVNHRRFGLTALFLSQAFQARRIVDRCPLSVIGDES